MIKYKTLKLENDNQEGETYSIILTGDFCPVNIDRYLINEKKADFIYGDLLEILKESDLSITNLECVLTDRKQRLDKVGPCLKGNPSSISVIKSGSFKVACLANNHILDYQAEGLLDTLKICKSVNMLTVGAAKNVDAARVFLKHKVKGKVISILNYAEQEFSIATVTNAGANPFDIINVVDDIKQARNESDVVLVIVHGGIEGYNLPSPEFQKKLKFIASYNPTAIICHHSHLPSGFEIEHDVPIFYSLGNFIFDTNSIKEESWYQSYLVRLNIGIQTSRLTSIDIIPFRYDTQSRSLVLLSLTEFNEFNSNLTTLNNIIQNENAVNDSFKRFVDKEGVLRFSFIVNKNKFFRRLYSYFKPYRQLINYLHCKKSIFSITNSESHREVLIEFLKKNMRI
jgi:hypothetical protein